jgi:hypothetical protein
LSDINDLQHKTSPALMPSSALIGTYHFHKRGSGNRDYAVVEEMILNHLANGLVMRL